MLLAWDSRLSLDFFDSGLHTYTAVARLTLALAKLSCVGLSVSTSGLVAGTGYPNSVPKFITRYQVWVIGTRFSLISDETLLAVGCCTGIRLDFWEYFRSRAETNGLAVVGVHPICRLTFDIKNT